jgi:hypothetical protein
MQQKCQDEIRNKTMDILTNDQTTDLFNKVYKNPEWIRKLTLDQADQLLISVNERLEPIKKLHDQFRERNPQLDDTFKIQQRYSYDKLTVIQLALVKKIDSFSQDTEVATINETPAKKTKLDNRACPIWCYAYFQMIWEQVDSTKVFPMYSEISVPRRAVERYHIDGKQFNNQYHPLCNKNIVKLIKEEMKPKRRELLREAVVKLSEIYDSPGHVKWWRIWIDPKA